jgi:alpha-galactosidase/6-phospho-beta-glucosidase family protein
MSNKYTLAIENEYDNSKCRPIINRIIKNYKGEFTGISENHGFVDFPDNWMMEHAQKQLNNYGIIACIVVHSS